MPCCNNPGTDTQSLFGSIILCVKKNNGLLSDAWCNTMVPSCKKTGIRSWDYRFVLRQLHVGADAKATIELKVQVRCLLFVVGVGLLKRR